MENQDYDKDAEMDRIAAALEEALKETLPSDMSVDKIKARIGMIGMTFGTSRTSVAGSMVYAAFYARIVGLDVEKLHELLTTVDKVMETSPYVEEAKAVYAKANAEFHSKAAAAELSEFGIISPGNDKVH